ELACGEAPEQPLTRRQDVLSGQQALTKSLCRPLCCNQHMINRGLRIIRCIWEGCHMTRTNIGLLISFTLALTGGAANAAPLKSTLNESALGSGLVQQTHYYNGTSCHSACAAGHYNRIVNINGTWYCVTYRC